MKNPDRRAFFKTGIGAAAGLAMTGLHPLTAHAGKSSLSGTFSIFGLEGTVSMSIAGDLPDDDIFSVTVTPLSSHKALARVRYKPPARLSIKRFTVELPISLADTQRIWYTQQLDGLGWHAYIGLPWGATIPASGHQGSLVAGAQNRHGGNRGFIGLKDQNGDGSLGFRTAYGGHYLYLAINRFAEGRAYGAEEIDETLYVDLEDKPWYEAVSGFTDWYDREWGLSWDTPDACFDPVWNTWYPSLGKLSTEFIERNAAACAEMGFRSFIIDDGWAKVRGGDWTPNTEIFPDFAATIRRIKAKGLNAILYYHPFQMSVDAVSYGDWERFLTVVDGKATDKLCPRCREVQERTGRIAGQLMREYGLDGLKIDFLDASSAAAPLVNCEAGHGHSDDFVSAGVQKAMRLMAGEVRKVKLDAIIEYRINYSNIATRRYANCHRGQDTPNDPDLGRRHLAIIRSWCKGVATHSDPSFWSPGTSDENVARYLAGIMLYAVPTMSINFSDLPENHLRLIRAWLAYYHAHKAAFRTAHFEPLADDPHYSVVRISTGEETVIPGFLRVWPSVMPVLARSSGRITLFNGTSQPRIVTRLEGLDGDYRLTVTDLFLREQPGFSTIVSVDGAVEIDQKVPVGGMLILDKQQ